MLVEIYQNIHKNVFRLTCHWQKNKNILLRTQNYILLLPLLFTTRLPLSVVSHFGHGERTSVSVWVLFGVFFLFFVLRYLVIAPVCIAKLLSAFVRQAKKKQNKTKLQLHNKKIIHNIM